MAEKAWHPNFIKYISYIANHPNYKGLPISKTRDGGYQWLATAKSEVGAGRLKWCENKARTLGFVVQAGVYADVMLEIHPTKKKICQICGREMSLYYHYPNANFLKSLNAKFKSDFTECDHISDVWDSLVDSGIKATDVAAFLILKGDLSLPTSAPKETIIDALEFACRKQGKKCLGPGAMSNFPDRFDGFHSYNRCCRSTQDKGRSKENMKTYTKDRRAYEYWSDGNIHAANQFMGSEFFKGTSADHIGPISLGFVHDPRYLQPMPSGENSTKRDRLQYEDIVKIFEVEARTGVYPMSWYSKQIWEHIKKNYKSNPQKISTVYRDALKQNMANFMFVLWSVLTNCGKIGEAFLVEALLVPNFKYFNRSYEFNRLGEIVKETPRHYTDRNAYETDRYVRIAIDAVYDYNDKENRNVDQNLNDNEMIGLKELCLRIRRREDLTKTKDYLEYLMMLIQLGISSTL